MGNFFKSTVKFAVGTCFALGAATVATSVFAGKNVGRIVVAGFNGAKAAVQEELATLNSDAATRVIISEETEVSVENSEN
ncbi:MAG: hypothetical protein IJV74_02285 [Clostridia bacterium]|nr:hypothetical protein [Clostridia bacterium]